MRKSKRGQYALYALGEVLLVIFGILIALQVNNWNEDRLEQIQIRQYARSLVSDLERDIKDVEGIARQMQRTLESLDALGEYTRGKGLQQLNNLDLHYLLSFMGYRPYEWHRASIEQLKSSGALRNIRDTELAKKITSYDAFTHHLDDDFKMDNERLLEATRVADEVVDSNYPFDEHVKDVLLEVWRAPFEFPSVKMHELYRNVDLHLLTADTNKVKVLVNKYQQLNNIRAHVDHEIPSLLETARELIDRLNSEYPE